MSVSLLHHRVAERCALSPDLTAIRMGDEQMSYGELESLASRLARLLSEAGCGKGNRVGLFLPKGPSAIVGMLASLKLGCAYVPMDTESPAKRITKVLTACAPIAVLTDVKRAVKLAAAMADTAVNPLIVSMDDTAIDAHGIRSIADRRSLDGLPATPVDVSIGESDMAHILFTSGSTGVPKGVVISHKNVCAFLDWACEYFKIAEGDQLSGHSPFHFDLSTFDIYGSLSRGATLHLVPPMLNILAPRLAQFVRDARLTQWFSVPSVLSYLAKFDVVKSDDFPDLRHLIWCGEVMPTPTLRYLMERLPHVAFTNLYGPTEATIASSFYTVPEVPVSPTDDIPIGQAIPGESVQVLDDDLAFLPEGTTGEVCIGGVGLSPGYWQDVEKTEAVFRSNGNSPDSPRWYRTGDLGKLGEDGLLHYLGRADSQIKSRGHRIELGEIESALHSLDSISESVVVAIDTEGFEGKLICCAFTPAHGAQIDNATLRAKLAELVPKYMLPARWLAMAALPKNANGKHDRPAIKKGFEADEQGNQSKRKLG